MRRWNGKKYRTCSHKHTHTHRQEAGALIRRKTEGERMKERKDLVSVTHLQCDSGRKKTEMKKGIVGKESEKV